MKTITIALSATLLVLSAVTAHAGLDTSAQVTLENEAPGKQPEKKPSGTEVEAWDRLQLAGQLAAYGEANKDALALIMAAKLRQVSAMTERPLQVAGTGAKNTKQGQMEKVDNSAEALLSRASSLAGDNKELRAIIEEVRSETPRGNLAGPRCVAQYSAIGARQRYAAFFEGGQTAMVRIEGAHLSDLDLVVADSAGTVFCVADSSIDVETCRWTPRVTSAFQFWVGNVGLLPTLYEVCTN